MHRILRGSADGRTGTIPSPASGLPRRRVLLVDDHAVVRAGLATLINGESDLITCGEADSERTAIEAVRQLNPDIAVVDWSLGHHEASELVETLRLDHPQMPVLVLSIHDEVFYAERAWRAGATGYVMKQEATDKIVDAIRSVAAGKPYLSARAAHAVATQTGQPVSETSPYPISANLRAASEVVTTGTSITQPTTADSAADLAVSIVIPVYNAEGTIKHLVNQLIQELSAGYRLQIVLVDDGSSDRSATVCQRLHQRHPDVVDFVMLAKNFGEHNAVMAGLNCAEGDYCVIMDDDLQNPPGEVKGLIEEIQKGHDVVYVRYDTKHHSAFRNAGSRLHNWMATYALGKPRDLYLSSFKVMSRFLVREVVHYTGPDPYLDAIILRTTRRVGVVQVQHEPRKEGKSSYTLGKLIALWGNMVIAFSLYPVRLLGLYGLVTTTIGFGYGLYVLTAYISPAIEDPDSMDWLNASIWFTRGLQALFLALIAEYAGRIYMHLTRAPQFIVRNIMRRRNRG